jgi:hypothetical protein
MTTANLNTQASSMLFSNEISLERIESLTLARHKFLKNDKAKLTEQIEDLTTTVQINKNLISTMFS